MKEILNGTRFITVAAPSDFTNDEWIAVGDTPEGPVHSDYALLKVLYMLRAVRDKTKRVVRAFKYEEPSLIPIDFSGLDDSDIISIVGHGDAGRVYNMGPDPEKNTTRLVQVLTKDGNLKKKRKDKRIIILLLSCQAGLGLHKALARKLFIELGRDVTVVGAKGFTFGSVRTMSGVNEVLIKGLPWFMEYPDSITKQEAEKETSAREKKTITYDQKEREILFFQGDAQMLEKKMKDVVKGLKSKEVNAALDELAKDFFAKWGELIAIQAKLYRGARTNSNLEFDMWYPDLDEAYVWANGKEVTDQEVAAFFKGFKRPSHTRLTSIK